MAKKYQKPKPTGREYIDKTEAFFNYTVAIIERMPEKWKDYILNPVFESAYTIVKHVEAANSVYMKANDANVLIGFYKDRDLHLKEALRTFNQFDKAFERMMNHVDFMKSESIRMSRIMWRILHNAGIYSDQKDRDQKNGDNVQSDAAVPFAEDQTADAPIEGSGTEKTIDRSPGMQKTEDPKLAQKKRQTRDINQKLKELKDIPKTIHVENHIDEIHYETVYGKERMKLGLTNENKNYLLKVEGEAKKEIQNRLSKDRAEVKALQKKLEMSTSPKAAEAAM